jgi:hypothetical protein
MKEPTHKKVDPKLSWKNTQQQTHFTQKESRTQNPKLVLGSVNHTEK